MAVTLCLSCSPDTQLEVRRSTQLDDGFLYCILSASSLYLNSSGSKGPFGLMWLSLPHLVYNSVRSSIQLHCPRGRRTQLEPELNSTGSSNSTEIIVRLPLDLWNRMFNRYQAEITVMQFTGHSLPVHHSVVYHGNFLARPISSADFHPRDFLS